MQAAIQEQRRFQLECRIQTDLGEHRRVAEQGQAVFNDTREIVSLEGFMADVSVRKQAEAALRNSERRYRTTFDQAAVGVAQVGQDGWWLSVTERLCEISGYKHAGLMAHTFRDITHPADVGNDESAGLELIVGTCTSYRREKRYIHKQGCTNRGKLTVSQVRDNHGAPTYFVTFIEDTTTRKQAEQAQERLLGIVEATTDLLVKKLPMD